MFAFIRGILIAATPLYCILDANGVGYKLFTPTNILGKLPEIGKETLLYSSFIVREHSQALYGFFTVQERDLFELLLGATGVGPKMALSIIGHLSAHEFHTAIAASDCIQLCKIPGIGKKTAERLIVEMRDKIKALTPHNPAEFSIPVTSHQQAITDAMGALIHLGYTQAVAQKAIKKSVESIPENADLATLITVALKNI